MSQSSQAIPPAGRPWRLGVIAAVLTAASVTAVEMARGTSIGAREHGTSGRTAAPTILLTAASQDGEVFLTWRALPDAMHAVAWRTEGETDWRIVQVGSTGHRTIKGLRNAVTHEFRVEARRGDQAIAASEIMRTTPRPRPECVTLDYIPAPPRAHFFCTKVAMDAYLRNRALSPLTLRCRQQTVTSWDDPPDCLYTTTGGEQLLLLRAADSTFDAGQAFPAVAEVRREARHAIWGPQDPFHRGAAGPRLDAAERALVGQVSKYELARSYALTSGEVSSRITWFVPAHPRPRRFAIYHEGHGGAAVEIGATTIDWLLKRGWQVIAMDMPLIGSNAVDIRPGLSAHGDFDQFDDGAISPVQQFVAPVKAVVDWLSGRVPERDRELLLIGRSGGGLTSYLYGALDPRIDVAVSVAGGRPISSRLDAPWGAAELGDYEQTAPHLYERTGHEYLMLAAGSRGAFYVFNRWDACCFRVQPADPFVGYLIASGRAAGKTIRVFVDEKHGGHSMSEEAYARLDEFLHGIVGR